MKVLISTRRNKSIVEEAHARAARSRCVAKYGSDAVQYDWEVDWRRPDGEKEKFNAAAARVVPSFDVVVLIEQEDFPGELLLGRGQCKCGDIALMLGRKVFVYRENGFVRVKGLRIVDAKTWKDGYGAALV